MRAILAAYGDETRTVWLADSFEGVPPPDAANYKADKGDRLHRYAALAVPEKYGRISSATICWTTRFDSFPVGSKDTLHKAPIERIAVLRLDGDLYESTIRACSMLSIRGCLRAASASSMTTTRSRHARRPSRITASSMG